MSSDTRALNAFPPEDLLHVIGVGAGHMRRSISELQQALKESAAREAALSKEIDFRATALKYARTERDEFRDQAERNLRHLGNYDKITLALSLLIEDLEQKRDHAKTKAAYEAFAYAIERLLEVHTPAGHGAAVA